MKFQSIAQLMTGAALALSSLLPVTPAKAAAPPPNTLTAPAQADQSVWSFPETVLSPEVVQSQVQPAQQAAAPIETAQVVSPPVENEAVMVDVPQGAPAATPAVLSVTGARPPPMIVKVDLPYKQETCNGEQCVGIEAVDCTLASGQSCDWSLAFRWRGGYFNFDQLTPFRMVGSEIFDAGLRGVITVSMGMMPGQEWSPFVVASLLDPYTLEVVATVSQRAHGYCATLTPTPTATPTATDTPTVTPSNTPTATATETPTTTPSNTPTASPTNTPTATPTATDTPTVTPSNTPTATPSSTPTASPTASPTSSPTATATASNTPTATPTPHLLISKSAVDSFPGGGTVNTVQGGSLITYSITTSNDSGHPLQFVDVVDSVPEGTEFVTASPVPVMANNTMTWHLAPFANGAVFTASFSVRVLTSTQGVIRNVAIASVGDVDWASNEVINVTIPTAITLDYFRAQRMPTGVVSVTWGTSSEQNTLGFRLCRSLVNQRNTCSDLFSGVIAATGSGTGARYQWTDASALEGWTVYYWLVEVETTGVMIEVGAAQAADYYIFPLSLTRSLTGAVVIDFTPPVTYMMNLTWTAPWPGSMIQVNRYQVPSYIFVDVSGALPITSTTWTEVSPPLGVTQYWVLVRYVEPGGTDYTERWSTGVAPAWDPALPNKIFFPSIRR